MPELAPVEGVGQPIPLTDPVAIADNQRSANNLAQTWLINQAQETASRAAQSSFHGEQINEFDQTWDQVHARLREEHPQAQINPLQAEEVYRQVRDNSFRQELLTGANPEQDKYNNVRYWMNRMPVQGHFYEAAENTRDRIALERIRNGNSSQADYLRLGQSMAYQETMAGRTSNVQRATDVATAIPGFGAEMWLAAPVGLAARGATTVALAGYTGAVAKAAQFVLPRAAQGFAMSAPMAANVTQGISERLVPDVQFLGDGRVAVGPDKSTALATWQAYLDTQTEIFTELAGGMLTRGAGRMAGMIPGSTRASAATAGLARWWTRTTGQPGRMFNEALKTSGWNGIFGEFLEERLGEVARAGLAKVAGGDQPDAGMTGAAISGRYSEALDQLVVEGLAFGAYGGAMGIAGRLGQHAHRYGMPAGGPRLLSVPEMGEFTQGFVGPEQVARHQAISARVDARNQQEVARWMLQAPQEELEQWKGVYPVLEHVIRARSRGEAPDVASAAQNIATEAAAEHFGESIGPERPPQPGQTANVAPQNQPQQGPPVAPGGVQTGNAQTSAPAAPEAAVNVPAPAGGTTGMAGLGGIGPAMGDNLRQQMFDAYQKGDTKVSGVTEVALHAAKQIGPGLTQEQFKQLVSDVGVVKALHKGSAYQQAMQEVVKKWKPLVGTSIVGSTTATPSGRLATEKFTSGVNDALPGVPGYQMVEKPISAEIPQTERRQGNRTLQVGGTTPLAKGDRLSPIESRAVDKYGSGNVHKIDLHNAAGESVGSALIGQEGKSLTVEWIGANDLAGGEGRGLAQPFGVRAMRPVLTQIAAQFPEAEIVKHTRSTGRLGAGKTKYVDLVAFRAQSEVVNGLEQDLRTAAPDAGVGEAEVRRDLGEAEGGAAEAVRDHGGETDAAASSEEATGSEEATPVGDAFEPDVPETTHGVPHAVWDHIRNLYRNNNRYAIDEVEKLAGEVMDVGEAMLQAEKRHPLQSKYVNLLAPDLKGFDPKVLLAAVRQLRMGAWPKGLPENVVDNLRGQLGKAPRSSSQYRGTRRQDSAAGRRNEVLAFLEKELLNAFGSQEQYLRAYQAGLSAGSSAEEAGFDPTSLTDEDRDFAFGDEADQAFPFGWEPLKEVDRYVQKTLMDIGVKVPKKKRGKVAPESKQIRSQGGMARARETVEPGRSLFEGTEPIAPPQKAQMKKGPRPGTPAAIYPEKGGNEHLVNLRKIQAYEALPNARSYMDRAITAILGVSGYAQSRLSQMRQEAHAAVESSMPNATDEERQRAVVRIMQGSDSGQFAEELFQQLKEKAQQETLGREHEPGTAYGVSWDSVNEALSKMDEQQGHGSITLDQFKRLLLSLPSIQNKIGAKQIYAVLAGDVPSESIKYTADSMSSRAGLIDISGIRPLARQITRDLKQIDDVSELLGNIQKATPALEKRFPGRGASIAKVLKDSAWKIKDKGAGAVDAVENLMLQALRGAPTRDSLGNRERRKDAAPSDIRQLIDFIRAIWEVEGKDTDEHLLAAIDRADELFGDHGGDVYDIIDRMIANEDASNEEISQQIEDHLSPPESLASMERHVDRPVKWTSRTADNWIAQLPGGGFFEATRDGSEWDIGFTDERRIGGGMTGRAGTKATAILRDVSAAFADFMSKEKPPTVVFSGFGTSRASLYERLAREAAEAFGYDLTQKGRTFRLDKNYQKEAESFGNKSGAANPVSGPNIPQQPKKSGFPTPYSIIALMEKLFDIPSSVGHLGNRAVNALALIKPRVIWVKGMQVGNMVVRLEEVIHIGVDLDNNIVKVAGGLGQKFKLNTGLSYGPNKDIEQGLLKVFNSMGRPADNNAEKFHEGFAELVRMRVMHEPIPGDRQIQAAWDWVNAELAKHPKVVENLDRIRDAFADFAGLNAIEKFAGRISVNNRPSGAYGLTPRETVKDWSSDLMQTLYDQWINDLGAAERFEKDVASTGRTFGPGERISTILAAQRYSMQALAQKFKDEGVSVIINGHQEIIGSPFEAFVKMLVPAEDLVAREDGATDIETFALARQIEYLCDEIERKAAESDEPEKILKTKPVGTDTEQAARAALAMFRSQERHPRLVEAANWLTNANNDTLLSLVHMEILDQEAFDKLRTTNPVYASMRRVQEMADRRVSMGKTKGERISSGIYKRFGSDLEFISPLQSYFGRLGMVARLQAEQNVRIAMDNLADAGLEGEQGQGVKGLGKWLFRIPQPTKQIKKNIDVAELAKKLDQLTGEPGLFDDILDAAGEQLSFYFSTPTTEAGSPAYVVFRRGDDGKVIQKWYEVKDMPLHKLLTGTQTDWQMPPWLNMIATPLKMAAWATKHTATTVNPAFLLMNIPRDAQTFLMNVFDIKSAKDLPQFLTRAFAFQIQLARGKSANEVDDELFRLFHYAGGEFHKLVSFDPKGIQKQYEALVKTPGWKEKIGLVGNQMEMVLKVLGAGEYGPRVLAFRDSLAKHGYTEERIKAERKADPRRDPVPYSILVEAMNEAAEVTTPFGRGGYHTRQVNQYIPFFQASIAGTDKLFRQAIANPKRMAAAAAVLAALEVMHHLLFKDEPWYNEQEPYLRYRFWAFPTPAGLMRFPKPQGLMSGGQALFQESLRYLSAKDPRMTDAMWQTALEFTPPAVPSGVSIPLDLIRNKDFQGRPIIPRGEEAAPGVMAKYQVPYVVNQLSGGLLQGRQARNPFAVPSTPNASVDRLFEQVAQMEAARLQARRAGQPFAQEREYDRLNHAADQIRALSRELRGERRGSGGLTVKTERPSAERQAEIRQRQVDLARRAFGQ